MRALRPSEYRWQVRIYLGEQCPLYLCVPTVEAFTEGQAIDKARELVRFVWPELERFPLDALPAFATQARV